MKTNRIIAALSLALGLQAGLPAAAVCALTNGQSATLVQGQADLVSSAINQGGAVAANTMNIPFGFNFDGTYLWVNDCNNSRVLRFTGLPSGSNTSADLVLGQANFTSATVNRGGVAGANTAAHNLRSYSDGTRLFFADTDNSRILIWNTLPTTNGQPADVVIGQADFTHVAINETGSLTTPTSQSLYYPADVRVIGGKLYIADTWNNRVLIFNTIPTANHAAADLVLFQPNMTSNLPNEGLASPALNTSYYPDSLESDGTKLAIADYFNNRALIFNSLPASNNAPADVVVGQPDGVSNGIGSGMANQLYRPRNVTFNGNQMVIADYGRNRVLLYNSIPSATGASADNVIGQGTFGPGTVNKGLGSVNAAGFDQPTQAAIINGQLWVADWTNNRLVAFGCGVLGTATPTATCSPTPTPPAFVTPCPAALDYAACNWPGLGTPGDLLMTMNGAGVILGLNRTSGTFYYFASTVPAIDGITTWPGDPRKVVVSQQGTGKIETFNASGVSNGIWGSTGGTNIKIGEFNPLDGSFWVPDQSAMKLFRIPAAGGAGAQINPTGTALNQPTAAVFDELGNLYLSNAGTQSVMKIAAASTGLSSPPATTLASGMNNLLGMVYDGSGALYAAGWAVSAPSNTSALWRIDTGTGAKTLVCNSFAPLSENGGGPLYQTDGVIVDPDGNFWMSQFQNPGSSYGLLKLSPAGTPLAYYPIPATVGGHLTGGGPPDDMTIVGQLALRPNCAYSPVISCGTATVTPSRTPLATLTATMTATPNSGLTPWVASPTVTCTTVAPLPTATPRKVDKDDHRVECRPNYARGDDAKIRVSVRSFAGGECKIKIHRANGRECRALWAGNLQPQEGHDEDWDTNDEEGEHMSSGVYYVVFTDGDGTRQKQKVLIAR